MKLKILLFIVLFSLISFISAYTAPVYSSVNLSLASSYVAPIYTSVNLSLSETEDTIYPSFSNYQDNNKTLINSGIGLFNVSVLNTNGSVYLHINNTDKIAMIQPAELCFQNLANVSTSCGGLNTGSYWTSFNSTDLTDPNAWYDGNDSTGSQYSGVDWKYFYANFSVPTIAVNGTIVTLHWTIPSNDLKYNFTISESSWNYSLITRNLSIRVGTNRSYSLCQFESMNSTGWDVLGGGSTTCGNGGVFSLHGITVLWNISNNYNASYNFTDPGIYPYYWYSYGNGSSHLLGQSVTRNYTVNTSVYSLNYIANQGYLRYKNCSPDWEFYPTYTEGQTSLISAINATNNGTGLEDYQIKLTTSLNNNWTLYACNLSSTIPKTDTNCTTLTTSYKTIWSDVAQNEIKPLWLYGNCSYVNTNPGASIDMQAVA